MDHPYFGTLNLNAEDVHNRNEGALQSSPTYVDRTDENGEGPSCPRARNCPIRLRISEGRAAEKLQKTPQSEKYSKNQERATKPRDSMIASVRRVRPNKLSKKVRTRRKRKHTELFRCFVSTSEYLNTNEEKHRRRSRLPRSASSDNREDKYYTTDGCSEAYYSSENSPSEEDLYLDDSGSSYESYSRVVRSRRRRASQWRPEYDLKMLGKGSYAVVYLSYSKANKKYFAVKCANGCKPSKFKSLTREADILRDLKSPYIIEYLGDCRVPMILKRGITSTRRKPVPTVTEIYLPYMKRGTLADAIRVCVHKKHMMKERVIRNYTKQIVSGLSYLHSRNIVHCDVKGSNILMGKTHLKISDFGLAKRVAMTPKKTSSSTYPAGTRGWMAPEVRSRKEQRFPADVWSLGCTVVQMITGKPPLSKEVRCLLQSESPLNEKQDPKACKIPKAFRSLSFECIDFLRKCFLKDPETRWTCKQLLDHPFLKDH